jgi:hypothetical protein
MLITRTSIFSRLTRTLDLPVTEDQVLAHENGALLQDAFPNLTAEEREFCKTGMTAEECNQMFTEEQKQAIPKPEEEEKWIVPPPQPPLKLTLNLDVEPVREEEITTKQPKPIRDSGAVSKKVYLTKYYYKNRLKQLRPILKYLGEEVFLAGGSIRTVLECSNEEVSDYDLFFKTLKVVPELREKLIQDKWENVFSCPEEKLFTYKKGNHKLQLICEFEYSSMENLLNEFDMTACCGGYYNGVIYFTRPFVRAVFSKKLRIQNVTYPVATIKRLIKYEKKGYNVTQAAIDLVNSIEGKLFDSETKRVYID